MIAMRLVLLPPWISMTLMRPLLESSGLEVMAAGSGASAQWFQCAVAAIFQGLIKVFEGSERKSVEQKVLDGRVSHLWLSCFCWLYFLEFLALQTHACRHADEP